MNSHRPKITVLYYIPRGSPKRDHWVDGFTSALQLMESDFAVAMVNLADGSPSDTTLNCSDFILVKSNWNWIVDRFFKQVRPRVATRSGIMISGSAQPHEPQAYDILFYETPWYARQLREHPRVVHAFGVNTDLMKPTSEQKKYDWISVGAFKPHKRYEKLLDQPGRGIVIGEYPPVQNRFKRWYRRILGSQDPLAMLQRAGIETRDFMAYERLALFYNRSKKACIPARLHGGGERCVLEARACGLEISIQKDNPKLESLLRCPVYDHHYYAQQLSEGVRELL
jgi:hypothetical protein